MDDKITKKNIGVRYGIIFGLIAIVYSLLLHLLNLSTNMYLSLVSFLILITGIIMSYREYKALNSGLMSVRQGLSLGMIITTFSTVLSSSFEYIYVTFIDDSLLVAIKEGIIHSYQEKGMNDDEITQAMKSTEFLTSPMFTMVSSIVMVMIMGFIASLIISSIMKNQEQVHV